MSLNTTNQLYMQTNSNLFHINRFSQNFGINYEVSQSKEEQPGLKLTRNEISTVIHSTYYPVKEAEKSVELFNCDSENIVIMGLGLAYHIKILRQKYPEKRIYVIDPDKDLFNYVSNYIDYSELDNVEFFIGYQDYDLSKLIKLTDFCIYQLKAYCKFHQNVFTLYDKRLLNKKLYDLREDWKYPKFKNNKLNIIFIDSSYVLTKECLIALDQLGHKVHYIHIDNNSYDYEQFIRNLMNDIAHFKPDFVLTVNHLGFDKEGRLTELLTEMEMPYVSWFVDSPNIILSCFSQNISDLCNIFVWDRDYINDVIKAGYPNVDYLPLGTSPEIFYNKPEPYKYEVSFVGSSMVYATHKNIQSFIHRPDLLSKLELVSEKFMQLRSRYVSDAIEVLKAEKHIINFEDSDQKDDFEAAVLWRSTQKYRLSGILKLPAFITTISGDPNWPRLVPEYFNIIPERFYYDNLVDFYNSSRINFNMTSLQMKNAVNQRVFDVPATNQFLLTDNKEQLYEVFDCKTDVAVFNQIEEIPELTDYYLKHEQIRQKMANEACKKVLSAHTYRHRLQVMIEIMKKRYK